MFWQIRVGRSVVAAVSKYVSLTKRMSSSLLIESEKYGFLKELGLETDNPGVFDGHWVASGKVELNDRKQNGSFVV